MTDATTIETEIEQGLALAVSVLPSLINLPTWVVPVIQAAMRGVQLVQQSSQSGTTPATAAAAVVDHLTPGAPAAAALQ